MQELIERANILVHEMVERDKCVLPFAVFRMEDKVGMALLEFPNKEAKFYVLKSFSEFLQGNGVDSVIIVSEIWYSEEAKPLPAGGLMLPSQDPDRREAVALMGFSRTERFMELRPFIREQEAIIWDCPRNLPGAEREYGGGFEFIDQAFPLGPDMKVETRYLQ